MKEVELQLAVCSSGTAVGLIICLICRRNQADPYGSLPGAAGQEPLGHPLLWKLKGLMKTHDE